MKTVERRTSPPPLWDEEDEEPDEDLDLGEAEVEVP
eukprot:CAMPEP_0182467830 /NCGR_PEP_ID=MMETSP1319-20130603/14579_1 /TAXON_ID=172717 /ORGANISM="Bolidomonas pacifica, Strain RCC208" /LENGTH=35 /DNA_ID= /DNA_START= /DNA_END= /DNA_ORIENTATION=